MADVWKRKGESNRRKSKPWVADFVDATGKRRRLSAATKEEAQELLAQKRREARETGPTVEKPDLTVAAYAEAWMRQISTEVKPSTLKNYAWALREHIIPQFGTTKLRDLTHLHVKQFLNEKLDARLSRKSVQQLRAVMSSMLGEAMDDLLVTKNAAKATTTRRRRSSGISDEVEPDRPLAEPEISSLLSATRDQQELALLTLLARTGVRPGEAMALQWSDPNFTRRKILIERAIHEGHLGTTKSGKVRTVDMSQQLAAALSGLYVQREREKLEGRWSEIPIWIFCQRNGEPLTINQVRTVFDRALKRAGLSGHVTYDLRHSFATLLLAKGTPLTYVSAQLGHKKPTTTLLHYSHWIQSGDNSYVDSLDSSPQALAPLFGTTRQKAQYSQANSAAFQLTGS